VPEIPALTYDFEELESHVPGWGYPLPYAAYRGALVDPPEGSDLLEDWELFYLLARELARELQLYMGILRTPGDMTALGIEADMLVAITSRRATVHAVVNDSDDLRRGVISMSHGYGIDLERLDADSEPGEPQPFSMGNHTGALASADLDYEEPHTGIPRMSSIPVHVTVAQR
jgi:anaerobic selenocysteine-containing dehydrogenase